MGILTAKDIRVGEIQSQDLFVLPELWRSGLLGNGGANDGFVQKFGRFLYVARDYCREAFLGGQTLKEKFLPCEQTSKDSSNTKKRTTICSNFGATKPDGWVNLPGEKIYFLAKSMVSPYYPVGCFGLNIRPKQKFLGSDNVDSQEHEISLKIATVHRFIVSPEFRGLKVAEEMLKSAEQAAKDNACQVSPLLLSLSFLHLTLSIIHPCVYLSICSQIIQQESVNPGIRKVWKSRGGYTIKVVHLWGFIPVFQAYKIL